MLPRSVIEHEFPLLPQRQAGFVEMVQSPACSHRGARRTVIEMTGLLLEGLSNGRCSTPNAFDLRETTPNKESHLLETSRGTSRRADIFRQGNGDAYSLY